MAAGGGQWERGAGVRDGQMRTIPHRTETNKVRLHSTGKQNQDPAVSQSGKEDEEDCRHKRVTKPLCCEEEMNTILCTRQ